MIDPILTCLIEYRPLVLADILKPITADLGLLLLMAFIDLLLFWNLLFAGKPRC